MSNLVRANFCCQPLTSAESNYNLLLNLQKLGFLYGGTMSGWSAPTETDYSSTGYLYDHWDVEAAREVAEKLTIPGHQDIELQWRIEQRTYKTSILKLVFPGCRLWRISLDVDDTAFFPKRDDIRFYSLSTATFMSFESAIIEMVKHLKPSIGVVDREADVICEKPTGHWALVHWGNYLPWSVLNTWRPQDVSTLLEAVDYVTRLDDLGLLFFIRPLAANQAWTEKHEKVHQLYVGYGVNDQLYRPS